MLGFLIALIMFLMDFLNHVPSEKILIETATWLNHWYVGWGVVTALLIFIGVFMTVTHGAVMYRMTHTVGGQFVAMLIGVGGLVFGWFFVIMALINNALLIAGTYLMCTSGSAAMTFDQFDMRRLIVGAVLLLIGLSLRVRYRMRFS